MKYVSWAFLLLVMALVSSSAKSETPTEPNINFNSANHNGGQVLDAGGAGRAAAEGGVQGSGSQNNCYNGRGGAGNFTALPAVCKTCHPGGVSSQANALRRVEAGEMPPSANGVPNQAFITFLKSPR